MKGRNRSFPLQRADDLFFLIMYAAYYLYINIYKGKTISRIAEETQWKDV